MDMHLRRFTTLVVTKKELKLRKCHQKVMPEVEYGHAIHQITIIIP